MLLAGADTLAAQKPESARIVSGPLAPARRTRPASSRTKRSAPRIVLAWPLRILMCSTSPLSARVARSGWYPRRRVWEKPAPCFL